MKHKHYEMIVAKAANMELVVFQTDDELKEWHVLDRFPMWGESTNYFLCLPQHKDACLHWLNGGEVEARMRGTGREFEHMTGNPNKDWSNKTVFTSDECDIRIKPKKEKRWIATFPWSGNAFCVTPESFASKELLNDYVDMHYGKRDLMLVHEIEVEV